MKRPLIFSAVFFSGIVCGAVPFLYALRSERGQLPARLQAEAQKARLEALVPYCLAEAKADPHRFAVLLGMKGRSREETITAIMAAGWASPLGSNKPDAALAQRCRDGLDG